MKKQIVVWAIIIPVSGIIFFAGYTVGQHRIARRALELNRWLHTASDEEKEKFAIDVLSSTSARNDLLLASVSGTDQISELFEVLRRRETDLAYEFLRKKIDLALLESESPFDPIDLSATGVWGQLVSDNQGDLLPREEHARFLSRCHFTATDAVLALYGMGNVMMSTYPELLDPPNCSLFSKCSVFIGQYEKAEEWAQRGLSYFSEIRQGSGSSPSTRWGTGTKATLYRDLAVAQRLLGKYREAEETKRLFDQLEHNETLWLLGEKIEKARCRGEEQGQELQQQDEAAGYSFYAIETP